MADLATARIDRWLLAARCFKTRTLAQEACDGGHVQVNGRAADAGRAVRVGDRVAALTPAGRRVLEIVALGVRRGSADEARSLYVDHTPPPPPSELPRVLQRIAWRDPGAGRPTKRDGRAVRRLRGDEADP